MTAELIATGLVLLAVVVVRIVVGRLVRNYDWHSVDEGRRWLVRARNLSLIAGVLGIVLVWGEELRVIGLSLVAVAVAVTIAGQDLIRSVVGSFVRATSGSFTVGDRIRAGELRGDVIDHSLLSTTILEIGPNHIRTGRTVSVPNSWFLTQPVYNETAGHDYILHSVEIPIALADWRHAEQVLLTAAETEAAPYLEPARQEMTERARRHALPNPIVDPFVTIDPTSSDAALAIVRVPVAALDVWQVERALNRAWLEATTQGS